MDLAEIFFGWPTLLRNFDGIDCFELASCILKSACFLEFQRSLPGLKQFLVHDFDGNVKNLLENSPVSIQNGHL